MAKRKFYVVWKGLNPGVYNSWPECHSQTYGFRGASYKSYPSLDGANKAFAEGGPIAEYTRKLPTEGAFESPEKESVCVSATCNKDLGTMEYIGVRTLTKGVLFHKGPYPFGTNDVGEFLAIVLALAQLNHYNDNRPIYCNKEKTIRWIKGKICRTELAKTKENAIIFELIEEAENWLRTHKYANPVLKWETDQWGENPADFGRK